MIRLSRTRGWVGKIVLLVLLGLLIFWPTPRPTSASSALVPLVQSSQSPLLRQSQRIGQVDPQQQLLLSVALTLHNVSALKQYLQELYTPGSYLYHHYLQANTFAARYGPTQQDVQTINSYLEAHGMHVTGVAAGRQIIDVNATVAQAEQTFGVQLSLYRTRDGRTFYSNDTTPLVPLTLRPLIQQISGLSGALVRNHPPLHLAMLPARSPRTPACPAAGSSGSGYYTPTQLAAGYNFTDLYAAGKHGEGQSIALFELDGYLPGDISGYQQCFDNNAPTRIVTKQVDNGVSSPGNGGLEVSLDMDVLLGMLPQLANLYVYEAPNTGTGYNDEWAQILNDNIPVISTSWGTCEANLAQSDIAAEQQFFMQAAAQGQSVLAASGDSGAYDCGGTTLAVDDPASNPYVTGVGGTTLSLNGNNSYGAEISWSDQTAGYGSGGGVSQLWTMPSYQQGTGVISSNSSGIPCNAASGSYCRQVPDVALNADPNSGYLVYCTISAAGCQSSAPFVRVGGTSAAAPMWAAIVTLTNQYILAHGGNNLGFLNPTLYALLANNTTYGQAFHDITTGTNLYYTATSGYDMATGLGSANAYAFALAATTLSSTRIVPASTRWYFAEGHLGNGFQEYLTLENANASAAAHTTITYLLRGQSSVTQTLTLNPGTRTTVNVNLFLHVDRLANIGLDVSLIVTADNAIIAERPLYFTFGHNVPGGSDLIGATQLGEHFTFANASTIAGYSTFLTILNPPGQPNASVTISYESGGNVIGQTLISAPAGQRSTISLNAALGTGHQCLIQVDSSQPITVERPLYFRTGVTGINGLVTGGDTVAGVTPATNWYFPAGDTGKQGTAQEQLILANPTTNTANVSILYALGNGTTRTVTLTVPPRSQALESVNHDVGNGLLVALDMSVTNGVAIVAERQQFFFASALVPTPTGIEVVGTGTNAGVSSLPTVYSFAEGHLGSSFTELVTLFNPNTSALHVAVTCFLTSGAGQTLTQQQVIVPALGIIQLSLNTVLNVPTSATTASGKAIDVALVVQSLSNGINAPLPVLAERSLYFTFVGAQPGETSVVGFGA